VSRARAARSSQRGPAAVSALNVFFYLTYEGNVDLAALTDPAEVRSLKAQINNFGQMPPQLLLQAHPARRARPPPASPCAPAGAAFVPALKHVRLEAVPIVLLPHDDTVVVLDAQRQLVSHRTAASSGRGSAAAGVNIGEATKLPAFAPDLALSRAVVLATVGRDTWLVSGGHWDCSLCVSSAFGAGGTRHRLRFHSECVTCVAVSSCGRWLISGSLDATAMLWSLERSGLENSLQGNAQLPKHVLRGHSGPLQCVGISSVLRLAVTGSRDGTAALYTLRDGRRVRVLREPAGAPVDQVLLADAGYVILACAAGSSLHLFTLNGSLVWSAPLSGRGVSAFCLSPCQTTLACGFDDGALCAWSLHDRRELAKYEPCPAPVVCMALTDSCLFVGTSRAELLMYLPPAFHAALCPGIRS